MKLLKILFIIVALFFFALICGGYFVAVAQAGGIGILLALVGIAVVTTLCAVISRPIASARNKQPRYSAGQKEALAQAEERDRLNGQKNQENEAAARAEYEKNLPAVVESTKEKLREKTEELHNCAFQLKEHLQTFYAMDQLSDDDKSLQTIDCLIYFIETHRADSIKEALREYDKAVAANQLAALESQRVSLLKQQIRMQQEQMEMTRSHQRNVEATLQQAAAQAASDRARQRDMMYVHYLNVETELGSIASNSGKIADAAELYSAKYY